MAFIHQKSCECAKTELDLFSLPPTQTSIDSGKWVQYKQISSLTDDSPIEFVIPGHGDEYTDLSQTLLHIQATIVKEDGTSPVDADPLKEMGPINNWLHSLFSQVDLYLNRKLVTPQTNTYAYRAYLENLLNYGREAKTSHLTCALWYKDDDSKFDDCEETNDELNYRRFYTNKSRYADMVGHLHIDVCNQNKFMLNGVEMRLRLVRSKNAFAIMSKTVTTYKDLKDFMDSAPDGVILLSLGSVINDEAKPQTYFTSIANAFKKLPQRVIWKTGRENIPGLPENVMLVKWMPQQDILEHPNCVLFMTHGGSGSYYEAIHAGVPVVGIPHFADQHRNVAFYVARGVGVRILPEEVTEDTVTAAVRTVLGDLRYKENMRRLSRVFRDTVTSPRQAVVYWTDYVIRHRGAAHLKPSLARLTWYQRTLIDVMAFGVSVFIAGVGVVYVAVRTISFSCRKLKISSMLALKKMD